MDLNYKKYFKLMTKLTINISKHLFYYTSPQLNLRWGEVTSTDKLTIKYIKKVLVTFF